jgi:hypothetical protein
LVHRLGQHSILSSDQRGCTVFISAFYIHVLHTIPTQPVRIEEVVEEEVVVEEVEEEEEEGAIYTCRWGLRSCIDRWGLRSCIDRWGCWFVRH